MRVAVKWLWGLSVSSLVGMMSAHAAELQPATYSSPSGEYVLSVDPSEREGAGQGTYELRRHGEVVWSGRREFTFQDVVLTDQGLAGGYAYSEGTDDGRGQLIAATLDVKGNVVAAERLPRNFGRIIDGDPEPIVTGLFLDTENHRFVARVARSRQDADEEVWWTFSAIDGHFQAAHVLRPTDRPGVQVVDRVQAAHAVVGTPLTLLQWWRIEESCRCGKSMEMVRFELLDADYRRVWSTDQVLDERHSSDATRDPLWQDAIIDTREPQQFAVLDFLSHSQVTYKITRDQGRTRKWIVTEVARSAYLKPVDASKLPAVSAREITLPSLGSIQLGQPTADAAVQDIHGITDFAISGRGEFALAEDTGREKSPRILFVDPAGRTRRAVVLTKPADSESVQRRIAWIKDDRLLVVESRYGEGKTSSAFWIDVHSGDINDMPEFHAPHVDHIAPSQDGGFVALTTENERLTMSHALMAFDADGKLRWQIGESGEGEAKISSPEDVTVNTAGEIVLLDGTGNTLNFFTAKGKFLRSTNLRAVWGRQPNYLTGMGFDRDGGVIVHDSGGKPSIVRMILDGKVRAEFEPAFDDGHRFDIVGDIQTSPDGKLWVTDGEALLRLGERGSVDRVLGERPNTEHLSEIAQIVVTTAGAIYAADGRTAAVLEFGEDGALRQVCRPDPGDYRGRLDFATSITVSGKGDVYISRNMDLADDKAGPDFLHYSSDCRRLGIEKLDIDRIHQNWLSQRGSENRWVLGYRNVFLVDESGTVVRKIQRTADGHWLDPLSDAALAPDGSIAVPSAVDGNNPMKSAVLGGPFVLNLIAPTGDVAATWPMPGGWLALSGRIAFDGKRIALLMSSGDGKKDYAVLTTDEAGRALFRFPLPETLWSESARLFLVKPKEQWQLWVFDGNKGIEKYAMP